MTPTPDMPEKCKCQDDFNCLCSKEHGCQHCKPDSKGLCKVCGCNMSNAPKGCTHVHQGIMCDPKLNIALNHAEEALQPATLISDQSRRELEEAKGTIESLGKQQSGLSPWYVSVPFMKKLLAAQDLISRAEQKEEVMLKIKAFTKQAGGMTFKLHECLDDIEQIFNQAGQ